MGRLQESLSEETREVLERYHFDEAQFRALQEKVRSGELSSERNQVRGKVEPTLESDITPLPAPGDDGYEEVRQLGREALQLGQVASVVLNGGMATRFGGVVKGTVEAYDGKSFLAVKLEQARRLQDQGADVPVALMNSYATDEATRAHLAELGEEAHLFTQSVSMRLRKDGELYEKDGEVSLYGPGHGDLYEALQRSGTLQELRDRGVRYVMVSNVDNLPATLDPVVIGTHIREGRPMTVEVVENEGDVGGSPVRVDGKVQVVEAMRYPGDLDGRTLPVVNVNTTTFDLEALEGTHPLTWVHVTKTAGGEEVVQLERMYHEASATLETTYLLVPKHGPRSRFLPVKTPEDLAAAQGELQEVLEAPSRV